MLTFLSEKFEIDETTLPQKVDWYSFGKARKEASFPSQRFVSKWINDGAATGRGMVRRKQRLLSKCPKCEEPDEHMLHILTCKSEDSIAFGKMLIAELTVWFENENIFPELRAFLLKGVTSWLGVPLTDEPEYDIAEGDLFDAASTQLELGWYAFLCGLIATPLIRIQQQHYTSIITSQKRGERWAIRLIHKCWNIIGTSKQSTTRYQ